MEDLQVTFTVKTEDKGTLRFHARDELDLQTQEYLMDWAKFMMQTAAISLIAQHIGTHEAARVKFSIT